MLSDQDRNHHKTHITKPIIVNLLGSHGHKIHKCNMHVNLISSGADHIQPNGRVASGIKGGLKESILYLHPTWTTYGHLAVQNDPKKQKCVCSRKLPPI